MVLGGIMKGEPLVAKLAAVAKYGVLPGAMIASLVYSPPDYALPKKTSRFTLLPLDTELFFG